MIDIQRIRKDRRATERLLRTKRKDISLDEIVERDVRCRELQQRIERCTQQKRQKALGITTMKAKEKKALLEELRKVDSEQNNLKTRFDEAQKKLLLLLRELPNIPKEDVKAGKDESENEVIREVGSTKRTPASSVDAYTLANHLGLVDLEHASRTSGSRFVFLTNRLVTLQFALLRYALDILRSRGFTPILPPVLINRTSMEGMGYLSHGGEDEVYHLPKDDLFLVGTAEQSIGPMYQGETVNEENLPIRFAAYSTCFRREAGSYGKDTKGFFRVHQFDKLEMFSFVHPDHSDEEHEFFLACEESFMKDLQIPYRVVKMCTGDLGDPAARKYDIEAWFPSQKKYRETHSTSTCTDYQARRLSIRFRKGKGTAYVHTVNGTAFAMGRTMIAIIENYQTADGSVRIPDVLVPYCGFSEIGKDG
jgi:seryl-tRNA synthetase